MNWIEAAAAFMLAAMFLIIVVAVAKSEEAQCAQLRALNQQYHGVSLSASERAAKAQLVSWYRANCGKKPKRTR